MKRQEQNTREEAHMGMLDELPRVPRGATLIGR